MAHRIITQVLASGSRIFGRAVTEAYKQASASQKYQAASANGKVGAGAGAGAGAARTFEASGLTIDEACKILDVAPPKQGKADMEKVMDRFKRLFDTNDPKKGGSFYLQSKVLRARQRLEMETKAAEDKAAKVKETAEGWKPKVYKD